MFVDVVNVFGALAEEIYDERLGSAVDFLYGLFQIGVCEEREYGPKDLILHHKGVLPGRLNDGWRDVSLVLLYLATIDHFPFMVVFKIVLDSVYMEGVNYFSVVAFIHEILTVSVEVFCSFEE